MHSAWDPRERIDSGGSVAFRRATSGEREALLIEAPAFTWVPWAHPDLWCRADSDPTLVAMLECSLHADPATSDRAVLEWAPGASLHELLRRGPLGEDETLLVARSVGRALVVLRRGALVGSERVPLVHGALGPRWIRIDRLGNVRLAGAGLGRLKPETDRAAEWLPFSAPELLAADEPTELGDVFAAGALLHHSMLGRGVYPGSTPELQVRAMIDGERAIGSVPPALHELISMCTAPSDRRPSTPDALAAIERLTASLDVERAMRSLGARLGS